MPLRASGYFRAITLKHLHAGLGRGRKGRDGTGRGREGDGREGKRDKATIKMRRLY